VKDFRAPGEVGAQERTWAVVAAAYADRLAHRVEHGMARRRPRPRRRLARERGRLDAPPGRLPRVVVVPVRPIHRRDQAERAARAAAGRHRPLDARAPRRPLPPLGGLPHRHAHRVPERRPPAGRGRGRDRRPRGRAGAGRARRARVAAGHGIHSRLRRHARPRLGVRARDRAAFLPHRRGRRVARETGRFVDGAFLPRTHRVVALTPHAVSLLAPRTLLFRTSGTLRQLVPSPDGRRLLVTWPQADQWLFVPTSPGRRLSAAGNIAEQLGGGFPVGGWTS
jgi:hypothetical protein